jgi:hypothetical protein
MQPTDHISTATKESLLKTTHQLQSEKGHACFCVALAVEQHLGRTVPPGSNVVAHHGAVRVARIIHTRQAEIANLQTKLVVHDNESRANLEIAVGVHKEIARFLRRTAEMSNQQQRGEIEADQVAVDDVRRVNVLQPTQHLVQEELAVLVRQVLRRANDAREIRLHQFRDHVAAHEIENRLARIACRTCC